MMKTPAAPSFLAIIERWTIAFFLVFGFSAGALASPAVLVAKIEAKSDHTSLTLTFQQKVAYQLMRIRGKDLISLDLKGLQVGPELKALVNQVESNDPVLRRLRVSNFSTDVVRLVFHLKAEIKAPVIKASVADNAHYKLTINFFPSTPSGSAGSSECKDTAVSAAKQNHSETETERAAAGTAPIVVQESVPQPDLNKVADVSNPAEIPNKARATSSGRNAISPKSHKHVDRHSAKRRNQHSPVLSHARKKLQSAALGRKQAKRNFVTRQNSGRLSIGLKQLPDGWRIEVLNLDSATGAGPATAVKPGSVPQDDKAGNHPIKQADTPVCSSGSGAVDGAVPASAVTATNARSASENECNSNVATGPSVPVHVQNKSVSNTAKSPVTRKNGFSANPLLNMLRSSILFANKGNLSGDYGQLYSRLSPHAQSKLSVEKMAESLKPFRDRKVDLSEVAYLEPIYFRAPWRDLQGGTHLNGYFLLKPFPVRFAIVLKPIADGWDIEAFKLDMPLAEEIEAQKTDKASAAVSESTEGNPKTDSSASSD